MVDIADGSEETTILGSKERWARLGSSLSITCHISVRTGTSRGRQRPPRLVEWLHNDVPVLLWGSTKPSNSSRIQSLQSKILRKILNAPYFVTNKIIHKDLNVPYVSDLAQSRYLSFHNKLQNHPNSPRALLI
ncbi:unnamed protein product [Nezara viridula]|uniref:Uncharacterized protein n=1 Tax=Nezara viridula TaxID=85310 RepID=A0A9P0MT24_NEZVI|nr:unnamed protein product [Nezara viridula]